MKINFEIIYNKSNGLTSDFVNDFKLDLSYCLSRFKQDSEWVSNGKEPNYTFICLSDKDMEDTEFISRLNLENLAPTNILVLTDKISNNHQNFTPHKFASFLFWDEIAETGEIRPYNKKNEATKPLYWERITDITVEITERLTAHDYSPENTIFLAQTNNSQFSEWLNIKRDLNDIGSKVLPNKLLSTNIEECTTQINNDLERCGIIIHLIPTTYNNYFTNSKLSVVEHQLNVSSALMNKNPNKYKRIIWIPSDYEYADEENQIFIEKIQRDQDNAGNTSIYKTSLEEIKRIYRKMLAGIEIYDSPALPDVYLISDKIDEKENNVVNDLKKGNSFKLETNFEGISYNDHLKYLANAQVVVLNYTNENEQWINVKVTDILKSPGLETSKPNKKFILIKRDKSLDTTQFESVFDEIKILESGDIHISIN